MRMKRIVIKMAKSSDDHKKLIYYEKPWSENPNLIWLGSTLSLFRNLDKFNFPSKLASDRQKMIIKLIHDSFKKEKVLIDPKLILAEDLEPLDKEYLTEHFFSAEGFYQAHAGEAFIVDQSGEFLATINITDHLRIEAIETKGELETRWNDLIRLETKLGKSLKYAFSPKFGFLTANPIECGTGMQVAVYLQLPALIHTEVIDDILEKVVKETITISGLHGSPTEVIGDILLIKNNYSLGVSEESVLTTIEEITTKLVVQENSMRSKIRKENNSEVKDRVSRAYGILIHSYQIEAVEALNALSLIKLGIDLEWVQGISIEEINSLFFNCRRAHLLTVFNKETTQEELAHKRAEYIHEKLGKVKLTV